MMVERTGRNLQGLSFERFDQSGKAPISFFRSDFRKTRITECIFKGNNFSRCDFISSVFYNTSFIECNFLTSSILYSVFNGCEFNKNKNFNPDLLRCRLSNCTFLNQEVARATWRDTSFVSCSFINCLFERSTLQNMEFENCNMVGLDLSQMTATDLHFANSSLDEITIDPDFLGTYTFTTTDLASIRFRYRSADLDLSAKNPEDFIALARHFEAQHRWSETFNILALLVQMQGQPQHTLSLEREWERCLLASLDLEIPGDAAENIRRLFRLAKHYFRLQLLTVSGSLRLVATAELIGRIRLNSLLLEEITTGAVSFLRAIETLPNFEHSLVSDFYSSAMVRFQVQIDTDDEFVAKEGFLAVLDNTAGTRGIPFKIIKVGFGSVVIEAATWFIIVMMLFRAARAASNTLVEIRLILKTGDRIARLIEESQKPKEILSAVRRFAKHYPEKQPSRIWLAMRLLKLGGLSTP